MIECGELIGRKHTLGLQESSKSEFESEVTNGRKEKSKDVLYNLRIVEFVIVLIGIDIHRGDEVVETFLGTLRCVRGNKNTDRCLESWLSCGLPDHFLGFLFCLVKDLV